MRNTKINDSRRSPETLRVIEGANQLARMVVDWRRENIMTVDDFCKSFFSGRDIDWPLIDVERGVFNVLGGCFIPPLCTLFSGNGVACNKRYSHQIWHAEL
jgi:hypothetical protein